MSSHDAMLQKACECGHRAVSHFVWGSCSECSGCMVFRLKAVQDVKPPRRSLLPWMYGFRERSRTLVGVGVEAELVTVSRAYLDDLEAVARKALDAPIAPALADGGTNRLNEYWFGRR